MHACMHIIDICYLYTLTLIHTDYPDFRNTHFPRLVNFLDPDCILRDFDTRLEQERYC
jgi:hypothetical protein